MALDFKKDKKGTEEKDKMVGTKRKKRQQVLIEQAAIIYNIIKGVDDNHDEDQSKNQSQFKVQNEYSWK